MFWYMHDLVHTCLLNITHVFWYIHVLGFLVLYMYRNLNDCPLNHEFQKSNTSSIFYHSSKKIHSILFSKDNHFL